MVYHQDILIRQPQNKIEKIPIKCAYKIREKSSLKYKHKLIKRDQLPEDFQEDEYVNQIRSSHANFMCVLSHSIK